jgi:hypothetical protein
LTASGLDALQLQASRATYEPNSLPDGEDCFDLVAWHATDSGFNSPDDVYAISFQDGSMRSTQAGGAFY